MNWDESSDDIGQGSADLLRIKALLKEEKIRNEALKRPLEFLCEDILRRKLRASLISLVDEHNYTDAKYEAEGCLNITIRCRDVYPLNVGNWLQKLVDCFHILTLWYIQDVLKECCIEKDPSGRDISEDRLPFVHLELEHANNENRRLFGSLFNGIYQYRNKNHHRIIRDEKTGRIKKIKRNFNYIKEKSIENAKTALSYFESELLKIEEGRS